MRRLAIEYRGFVREIPPETRMRLEKIAKSRHTSVEKVVQQTLSDVETPDGKLFLPQR